MATYHCSVKVGGKGRGAAHAAYISREPPYARRAGLEHSEHGNLPTWAQADPAQTQHSCHQPPFGKNAPYWLARPLASS